MTVTVDSHISTAGPLRIEASRRYGTGSPLRYPGGKAALAGLFADVIGHLELTETRYVEPYAGGAGAGVALLQQGLVGHVVINDIDPAVHAFWRAVVEHNDRLVEQVRCAPLTIAEWQRQREVYRAGDTSDIFQLGFAFFYLNRTNRSGILNAGVIGGQAQTGNYKIDARFNRDTLAQRLQDLGALADRITVSDLDGRTVIQRHANDSSTFMYIDPPYVQAGSQLYLNAFEVRDHRALADSVNKIDGAHWLMTYDVAPLIEKLYQHQEQARLALNYSARHPGRAEELVVASTEVSAALRRITAPNSALVAPAAGA
ncbi:MAG: DNA adenine methylase [Patulibacter sp.]|nr:DNA adenine methylase [Patulibacter sp.]